VTEIGKFSEMIRIGEDHKCECPGKCRLQLVDRYKKNFQIYETHRCNFCKRDCTVHSGYDNPTEIRKPGGQSVAFNMSIIHAAHASAMNPKQLSEFCHQAGIVCSSDSGMHRQYKERKGVAKGVCTDALEDNRIEHVQVCALRSAVPNVSLRSGMKMEWSTTFAVDA